MSVIQLVRCEQYDNCKQELIVPNLYRGLVEVPDKWFTLFEGNPMEIDAHHFCSELCLARWIAMRGVAMPILEQTEYSNVVCQPLSDGTLQSLVDDTIYQPVDRQEQLPCKSRRFLLVDGETADITEGVKWENGRVTIEPPYDSGTYTFPSWDRFKESYPGSGVQWIDQEVSE